MCPLIELRRQQIGEFRQSLEVLLRPLTCASVRDAQCPDHNSVSATDFLPRAGDETVDVGDIRGAAPLSVDRSDDNLGAVFDDGDLRDRRVEQRCRHAYK
ncbi:MAG: hypothetical protein GX610_10640 [Rhodococcus sp.]|nr:hypothetical protein [Rhodococcus sp. (in: high G+C Gram-positive bacteria)]